MPGEIHKSFHWKIQWCCIVRAKVKNSRPHRVVIPSRWQMVLLFPSLSKFTFLVWQCPCNGCVLLIYSESIQANTASKHSVNLACATEHQLCAKRRTNEVLIQPNETFLHLFTKTSVANAMLAAWLLKARASRTEDSWRTRCPGWTLLTVQNWHIFVVTLLLLKNSILGSLINATFSSVKSALGMCNHYYCLKNELTTSKELPAGLHSLLGDLTIHKCKIKINNEQNLQALSGAQQWFQKCHVREPCTQTTPITSGVSPRWEWCKDH